MVQTDRNTPSRFKIVFWLFKYNGFLSYNGYITNFFNFTGFRHFWGRNWRCAYKYNNRVPVRGASKRRHENEFCNKFWCFWRPYFRCSSSRTEKPSISSHARTACSIGTKLTHAFVGPKVSNWPKHTQPIAPWFGTIWIRAPRLAVWYPRFLG